MLSNHFTLPLSSSPFALLLSIGFFSSESALCIRWPKYWSLSFSISPFNEYSGLVSFRIDWFDLTVHRTLKSLLLYHISSLVLNLLYGPTLTSVHDYWGWQSDIFAFNMLSMFVISFHQKNKCLLILWLQSLPTVILELKKIKSVTISTFPLLFDMKRLGLDAMILVFWKLSFKLSFLLSSFSSSRGSLVPIGFLPLEWCHLHIWGCWYFSWQSWFQLVIHLVQHFAQLPKQNILLKKK